MNMNTVDNVSLIEGYCNHNNVAGIFIKFFWQESERFDVVAGDGRKKFINQHFPFLEQNKDLMQQALVSNWLFFEVPSSLQAKELFEAIVENDCSHCFLVTGNEDTGFYNLTSQK